jgi:hypothetical protein
MAKMESFKGLETVSIETMWKLLWEIQMETSTERGGG